jgi:hypothetical protein
VEEQVILRVLACASAMVALAGCAGEDTPPSDEQSAAPSLSASTGPSVTGSPSPSPSATPSADQRVKRLLVPAAAASLPSTWREAFVIPYGTEPELLGTSSGGDSEALNIGPEYGAAAPDGSWWFLDHAKGRLAHYDADGSYLDELEIDKHLLVGGRHYQWQLPHVLADGSLVAARYGDPRSYLYRVVDGTADEVVVEGDFSPTYDDGVSLFGSAGGSKTATVDPMTGALEEVDFFNTPSGARFSARMDFDKAKLRVELPDSGVSRTLPTRTVSGAPAHVGVEVRAGADDFIHLFLVGTGEDDESVQLVGYASVGPTGTVSAVEGLPSPFSESDPGSPAHLVIAPGSSKPMLVYVLEDGVHVYERR